MNKNIISILSSWKNKEGNVNKTEDLLSWIEELNKNTYVKIKECSINDSTFWFYDDYNGEILNRKRSFFSIKGMRLFEDGEFVKEQPMIIQPEIGYLGIICKEIEGEWNFLMQAKIEPGNVNCVQISPTIQATKSNFTRAHGGKLPTYFEYFENSNKYDVIYDQIQSEQASRFYKKRNRNMIMMVDEDIPVYDNFRWMTLGQIKELMKIDNLVNMDTRTVLSGLPLVNAKLTRGEKEQLSDYFEDKALYQSIFEGNAQEFLPRIYQQINNYKMFRDITVAPVPLNQLVDWKVDAYGVTCKKQADYMVRYYDIEISGREVQQWTQPLFKAIGNATFGLLSSVVDGKRMFLVKLRPEMGMCDKVELGPTVQWEPTHYLYNDDAIEKIFRTHMEQEEEIMVDVILSEEGGRFFHEQNRNMILDVAWDKVGMLPDGYAWVDFATLNYLVQVNNCLNIQLRNLLSLINL